MQYLGYLLVLIHLFLLIWSVGGFSELVFSAVPWKPFTNQDFPKGWLPDHWGSVLIALTGFLYGYFTHWSKTKYIAMALEYVAYTNILILLFKNNYFRNFFK